VGTEGGVTISGSLSYEGSVKGQVRLDFLRTEGDGPPHLLHVEKLDDLGTFSMQVPSNTGPVTVVAFIDVDNDGPNSSDPAGLVQLAIEESTIANVSITLADSPDLGDLTPGDDPPPGTEVTGAAAEEPPVLPPNPEVPEAEAPTQPPAAPDAPPAAPDIPTPTEHAPPSEPTEGSDSE
jgi:hypothetical protein